LTFRLFTELHRSGLLEVIRRRVAHGMPYIGSGAGAIVARPTLKTTKDTPIVEPPPFEAARCHRDMRRPAAHSSGRSTRDLSS
jgi:dipeptidase E